MSQQGLILVHTEKLKPKGPISALASVLLGENPSEEVDDYDNYDYAKRFSKKYGNKGWASTTCNPMSRHLDIGLQVVEAHPLFPYFLEKCLAIPTSPFFIY